jgi:hypothetical protein
MQNAPAEVLKIAPENLEVANCWLQLQDTGKVSQVLNLSIDTISSILNRKEVRSYTNHVFFEVGYNNKTKMRKAMDALITRKFKELDEAEIGSSKDIADLLVMSHKMTMDLLDKEIQIKKLEESIAIKNQTNIQINDSGNKYAHLLEKLIESEK